MSSMTTNMFAPRIWVFDRRDTEWRVAREAGWSRADLIWERLMEAGNLAAQGRAARLFAQADWLARLCFAKNDPRRATALAARARWCDRAERAEIFQKQALAVWRHVSEYIEQMEIRPRARSSLFHLRMEAKHRQTYHDNLRHRLTLIAGETEGTLRRLTGENDLAHRHFSRWKGEKPSVHDDTRKLLSACLLIPDHSN